MHASLITAGTVRGTLPSMYPRHHINETATSRWVLPSLQAGDLRNSTAMLGGGEGGLEPSDLGHQSSLSMGVLPRCVHPCTGRVGWGKQDGGQVFRRRFVIGGRRSSLPLLHYWADWEPDFGSQVETQAGPLRVDITVAGP